MGQNTEKTIVFIVEAISLPDTSNICITGNQESLGNWNAGRIKLNYTGNSIWKIKTRFPLNTQLEYKITRGSWETEALDVEGNVPANSVLQVTNDTTIYIQIDKWKDKLHRENKGLSTQNLIYHRDMEYPGLKSRDIAVYLPHDYSSEIRIRYPVLYMHDGQNLFDPATSFLGVDWQIDETVDSLIRNNEIQPIIIVGIYNTTDRKREYSHTNLGKKYMEFIIRKLKPFIDQKYRTLPDRENTAVGGSSMGGLISFMLVWEYSNIFSKAICMSPAFKIDTIDYVSIASQSQGIKKNIKIYIDNGGIDIDKRLQPGIDEMMELLRKKSFEPGEDFWWYKDKNAPHNEVAWAARFWRPLKYFYKK